MQRNHVFSSPFTWATLKSSIVSFPNSNLHFPRLLTVCKSFPSFSVRRGLKIMKRIYTNWNRHFLPNLPSVWLSRVIFIYVLWENISTVTCGGEFMPACGRPNLFKMPLVKCRILYRSIHLLTWLNIWWEENDDDDGSVSITHEKEKEKKTEDKKGGKG